MKFMLRSLFVLLFLCVSGAVMAQTPGISGTLTDERGNPIVSGSVTVIQGGINRGGAITDFDGKYVVKPLDPGRYDVKFSSQGVEQTVAGVVVGTVGEATVNLRLVTTRDLVKGGVTVRATRKYQPPLIDPKKPGGVGVKLAESIEKSATVDIVDQTTLTTQAYQSKNGNQTSLGGGRVGTGTTYVVDGVQLASGNASFTTPPQGSVDQVATYVSGIPARYGDASGGVVTITTKGFTDRVTAGVRLQHSVDGYNNNLGSFNLSGPLLRRKDSTGKKKPIVGFALNGEGRYNQDNNPSYYKQYTVNDAKLQQLQQSPLTILPGSSGDPQTNYVSETVRMSDMEQRKRRENVASYRGALTGKLVYALSDKVNIAAGGEFYAAQSSNYNADNVAFNSANNSQTISKTGRGYLRLTQKFANAPEDKDKKNTISNAFYTVQADYQKDVSTTQDKNHKHNSFDYGYVGKFEQGFTPSYASGYDATTGIFGTRLVGYSPSGIKYTRDEVNPVMANYTQQYYSLQDPARIPTQVTISDVSRGLIRNGDAPTQVYGQFNNAGTPNRGWSMSNADQLAFQVDASFDLKQKRTTHSIEFGLYYQQRNERYYSLNAAALWDIMRLQTTRVVDGSSLNETIPTFRVNGRDYTLDEVRAGLVLPGPNDTILYTRQFNDGNQGAFDKNLRAKLGKGNFDYLNTDAIDRSNYSLNMFAPDELTIANQPIVTYQGYDYTGKRLTGQVNFNDYFTQKNSDGVYTRPIGAYRPNYIAGYLSDYIQYKDFLIYLGVRVERFDANTKVLSDPYTLTPAQNASQYDGSNNAINGGKHPGNIGGGYVVYVGENATKNPQIIGYRNGDTWYDAIGNEVQDPLVLSRGTGNSNLVPMLQYEDVASGKRKLAITDTAFRGDDRFTDYKPQVNAMPRINFSFPLNDNALFYAHYDVMVQRPVSTDPGFSTNYATAADYRFLIYQPTNIIGNPDLKPEKLIDYEVGFQQKLTDKSSVTLSGFYKERKDQIQIRQYYQAYPTTYFTYGNRDFSTTKGFSLNYELRRINNITMSVNYTLSFNEGTGSDAASANGGSRGTANTTDGLLANYIGAGLPNQRNLFPVNYDSRHNINAQIDYRYLTGEGPEINGVHFLENAGANLIFRARSGEPYTRYAQPNSSLIAGTVNGSRLPWHYMFDLNLDKSFNFGINKKVEGQPRKYLALNVFVYVQNLLNTRDVLGVYGYTGRAGDNGYLTSAQGINQTAQQVDPQAYKDMYGLRTQDINQLNNPRRIVVGIKLNL